MDRKNVVPFKRLRKFVCLACMLVALVALTGCETSAQKAENDLDIKMYWSHVYSGEIKHESDPLYPIDRNYIEIAAVVTNNSDKMYQSVIITPIAYDKDGNEIEGAITSLFFYDDGAEESDPTLSVERISAGGKAYGYTYECCWNADEEPEHIGFKVERSTVISGMNTDNLEISDVVETQDGLKFNVRNNNDEDQPALLTALMLDDEGFYIHDYYAEPFFSDESSNSAIVPANSTKEATVDFLDDPPGSYELFVTKDDYYESR